MLAPLAQPRTNSGAARCPSLYTNTRRGRLSRSCGWHHGGVGRKGAGERRQTRGQSEKDFMRLDDVGKGGRTDKRAKTLPSCHIPSVRLGKRTLPPYVLFLPSFVCIPLAPRGQHVCGGVSIGRLQSYPIRQTGTAGGPAMRSDFGKHVVRTRGNSLYRPASKAMVLYIIGMSLIGLGSTMGMGSSIGM